MDWVTALNLFYNKSNNNPILLKQIKLLKLNMNKNRKTFNWDHLKNFY